MSMLSFLDQLDNVIEIPFPPRRIVSLVPSQTELLADLGLDREIVGITKYCVHPPAWTEPKTVIGGTKNFDLDAIHELRPDLVIGNKEENHEPGITALRRHYPVWMSYIVTFGDVLAMINSLGSITDRKWEAERVILDIQESFDQLRTFDGQTVLYLIWRKPWMAAGTHTFINTMLNTLQLHNVVSTPRYPVLTAEAVAALQPAYIFLSSEPYPFGEKHLSELQAICPTSKIMLVDGEMFSWYGSRLIHAPAYFNTLKLA